MYKNVDCWITTSLEHELKKLKDNSCKFKILLLNCHRGKSDSNDISYGALSHTSDVNFTYESLKYLLKDRRDDEYYFIFLKSCFGGGLLESTTHT